MTLFLSVAMLQRSVELLQILAVFVFYVWCAI